MRPRILVVDDEQGVRTLWQDALGEEYNVLAAVDGYDALAQVFREGRKFDLIITDLMMPKLDGIDFVENLPEEIPFIVVSGFLDIPKFQEAVERLHPVAVLKKPVGLSALREAVKKGLGSRG